MWNLKHNTNEYMHKRNTLTDIGSKPVVTKIEREEVMGQIRGIEFTDTNYYALNI